MKIKNRARKQSHKQQPRDSRVRMEERADHLKEREKGKKHAPSSVRLE